MTREFDPDWTVSPGALLRRVLADRKLTEADLSRCGLLPDTTAGILAGTSAITEDAAIRISNATGVPSSFWLQAEHAYRRDLANGKTDSLAVIDNAELPDDPDCE